MPQKPLPSQADLNRLLKYDPLTGDLFWKPRTGLDFAHLEGGKIAPATYAKQWNTRFAGKPALTAIDNVGYRSGRLWDSQVRAHRIIWKMVYGEEPGLIDHKNRDSTDNRLSNLRAADKRVNSLNREAPKNNTSGVKGVCFCNQRQKWVAQIGCAEFRRSRRFDRKEDAIAQRQKWEAAAYAVCDKPTDFEKNEQHGD